MSAMLQSQSNRSEHTSAPRIAKSAVTIVSIAFFFCWPPAVNAEVGSGVKSFLDYVVVPTLPGALLLFALSAIFGSINFLYSVDKPGLRHIPYLMIWVIANYCVSLIILLLILPDKLGLGDVNRDLFLYCLIATAIPELAANVRLKMGLFSERTVDFGLHQYKEKIGTLINSRVDDATRRKFRQDLLALSYHYNDKLPEFKAKLAVYAEGLAEEQKAMTLALLEELEAKTDCLTPRDIVELETKFHSLGDALLPLFRDEILAYEGSPIANLMNIFGSNLSIDQAKTLIGNGILSVNGLNRKYKKLSDEEKTKLTATLRMNPGDLEYLCEFGRSATRRGRVTGLKNMVNVVPLLISAGLFVFLIGYHQQNIPFTPTQEVLTEDIQQTTAFTPTEKALTEDIVGLDLDSYEEAIEYNVKSE